MNMFCYQCQETGNGKGCTTQGICGKTDETANLQDLLIYLLQGMSFYALPLFHDKKTTDTEFLRKTGVFVAECLFTTITNTNFDAERIIALIEKALVQREMLRGLYLANAPAGTKLPDNASWMPADRDEIFRKSLKVGVLDEQDADIRSVKETITYGLKGLSAYAYHAATLGFYDDEIFHFTFGALNKVGLNTPMDELLELLVETGAFNVAAMAVLDQANSATYGNPEPTKVSTGIRNRPGILVSGHDLKDLELLLKQSEGKDIDIYTNGEMILAQSLPYFKKFAHFAGNYGNAWWQQPEEFTKFNGPVLLTSNCIVPVEKGYAERIFTTSVAGYPGVPHIEEDGGTKDFSALISLALRCLPPTPLNEPDFMSGFGHHFLHTAKDKVIDLIKKGKIKRFVAMGGCDGRDRARAYYTERALSLPEDT
ncbi:MAG: hydroxylamine reductase, partial [Elusimicrobia bacterium RIFOXYB2_FULL_49_7]